MKYSVPFLFIIVFALSLLAGCITEENGPGAQTTETPTLTATTMTPAAPGMTQTPVPTMENPSAAAATRKALDNQWTLIRRAKDDYNIAASRFNATDPWTLQNVGMNYMRDPVIHDTIVTITKAKADLTKITSTNSAAIAERDLLIGICDYTLLQMDGYDKTYQGLQVTQYDSRRAKTIFTEAKSSLQKATNRINGLSVTQQYEAFVQADIGRIEAAIARVNSELAQLPTS